MHNVHHNFFPGTATCPASTTSPWRRSGAGPGSIPGRAGSRSSTTRPEPLPRPLCAPIARAPRWVAGLGGNGVPVTLVVKNED